MLVSAYVWHDDLKDKNFITIKRGFSYCLETAIKKTSSKNNRASIKMYNQCTLENILQDIVKNYNNMSLELVD